MEHRSQKTIFFIRHGETTGDLENRYGGSYDDHLTEQGIKEALVLSDALSSCGIEAWYSSNLARAKETTVFLCNSDSFLVDARFNERDGLGKLTGMKKDEVAREYPELAALIADYRNTLPGGESYEFFAKRVEQAIRDAVQKSTAEKIAIVSHGGPLSVIFREILKKGEIKYTNCSFAELAFDGENFSVIRTEGITFI